MNTSYQIVEAKSTDGGALTISLPWEFELSEIFVVAEHEASGIAKVYEGAGTLTVDRDGNLVVPALFSGDVFRAWISRKTQIRHDYDSGGDTIDDKTIDAELKELSRKTVENEKEIVRCVRVPEGGINMMLPSKVFRSGEIFGFDENGNVAVGEGINRVREIYNGFREVKASEEKTNKYVSVAKENASIAIENRQKAKDYSDLAFSHATEAEKSSAEAHKYAQQLSGIYKYCGTVATVDDLPTENNTNGDVWNVADTGQNYAWDGEAWDALAGDTFATKYDLSAAVDAEATRAREAEEAKVNFFDTVVPDANDNAHIYGYVGTLGDLGAFGGACYVNRLTLRTRLNTGTLANPTIALYARILKVENGAWVVAAQSSNAHKWGELGYDADATFSMVAVPGVIPPSADEKIAIVLVNNPNAAAGVSNGSVSCRVVSGTGKGGGITAALGTPAATTGNANWHPFIRLRFAPLGGLTKEAVAKNPSWTLTHAYGSEITPVNFEFETESTGGDFGLLYEQGGTSRKLIFPDTSGTLALENKTVRNIDCFGTLMQHEASGGVVLAFEGINPEQKIIFPYYGGEDRTIATLKDCITLVDGLKNQGFTAKIDADLTNAYIDIFYADGSRYCSVVIPGGSGGMDIPEIMTKSYADRLYVPKSDYDALLARVEALEAAVNG